MIATSGRGHACRGVARGDSERRARSRLDLRRRFDLGATKVLSTSAGAGRPLLVGIARGRVCWLALAGGRLAASDGALRRALRRVR